MGTTGLDCLLTQGESVEKGTGTPAGPCGSRQACVIQARFQITKLQDFHEGRTPLETSSGSEQTLWKLRLCGKYNFCLDWAFILRPWGRSAADTDF